MPTECTPKRFEFEAVARRAVVACFDGGDITSNAGALVLGQVDRGLCLMRRFAACFTDRRDPRFVEHQVETLVGQRIFGLALGYEDLVDHDELRKDPTLAVLAGKLEPVLRSDCEALAGKSTLNRLEHTPKRHGAKYHKIDCDGAKVDALLVDLFVEAHERAPREIVIDLDNTDVPLYGMQEGRFFHGYYDDYCYLPLYAFCGRHLLLARQRLANVAGRDADAPGDQAPCRASMKFPTQHHDNGRQERIDRLPRRLVPIRSVAGSLIIHVTAVSISPLPLSKCTRRPSEAHRHVCWLGLLLWPSQD